MKKMMAIAALLVFFSVISSAQNAPVGASESPATETKRAKPDKAKQHKGKRKHGKMGKELGLTNEQNTQVKKVNDGYKGRMKAIKSDKGLSKEQKRAQMKELHQKHDEEMKGIMNAEQYGKWQQKRQERAQKMREHKKKQ